MKARRACMLSHGASRTFLFKIPKTPLFSYTSSPLESLIQPSMAQDIFFASDITATMERYSQQVADCVLEKAMKLCKNIENVETRVENGDPRDVICQMVQKLGADVLVMGSHGYGLIKRAFLGSVSNHCAQNVKCPVLIVKKPKPTAGET
uniref:UspA domain-containing protein n=1 Tax=Glycine max TaxID=3847 RepID=C6T9I2_SOYBN|nr:unknown [Glycine max]